MIGTKVEGIDSFSSVTKRVVITRYSNDNNPVRFELSVGNTKIPGKHQHISSHSSIEECADKLEEIARKWIEEFVYEWESLEAS